MSGRKALMGLVIIAAAGALLYVGYRRYAPARGCDVCGRARHPGMEAEIVLKDGHRVETCCARCAFHFELPQGAGVARTTVEDAVTGEAIEARDAAYLEGSDAAACHPEPETGPREPGVAYDLRFDRCLPSLVAFRNEGDAREFQRQHGGRLLTFTQALESVRHR
jgi:nitrous oxide reductase accessory protein NosL